MVNVGLLVDDDVVQDIAEQWAHCSGDRVADYENELNSQFRRWGPTLAYGDPITNSEIIAVLGIYLKAGIDVPKRLRKAAVRAISSELEPAALSLWLDADERAAALKDLLDEIGGMPATSRWRRLFRRSAHHYGSVAEAKKDLLYRARMGTKGWRGVPLFLRVLNRYVQFRIWEKDYNIAVLARGERLMMLVWYLGMSTGMSPAEIEMMLDRVVGSYERPPLV